MATSAKKICNLGLAGGGFFGISQVAALKELEKYSDHLNFTRIRGVSVGSLVAALYAVGYNGDELTKIIFEMDFENLIKDKYFAYIRILDRYGMYDAIKLEQEIEKLICNKTNIKNCTFCQIKTELTIISTNLNYQCPRFFNKYTTPHLAISKAVRMSIGYPVIMTPVLYEGDYYSDGGEFINYPITTFDDLENTIGITFAAHNEYHNGTLKSRVDIQDVYGYIKALASTLNRATYVSQITSAHLERSIVIDITENISSMQFNLTMDQKKAIYDCGVQAVRSQISKILGQHIVDHYSDTLYTINMSNILHASNIDTDDAGNSCDTDNDRDDKNNSTSNSNSNNDGKTNADSKNENINEPVIAIDKDHIMHVNNSINYQFNNRHSKRLPTWID